MIDWSLFERLLRLNLSIANADNAKALAMLQERFPIRVLRFASGAEHNGWVVPPDWRVRRAHIRREPHLLFDGTVHPLAVASHSVSFTGTVSKAELDRHVFFSRERPQAYAFHSNHAYRPWDQQWGFCIPWSVYADWSEGDYQIHLDTEFSPGEMVVGEWHVPGASSDTLVFNAHTCHPAQANDDMSGVMAMLALFEWIAAAPRRFSYRAVLAPEHLGTVFYLASLSPDDLARLKLGCFVEMVGSRTPLVLQQSFTGRAIVDRVAEHVLRSVEPALRVGAFRTIIGNDETVWEAPGIEVPMVSISRFPYPEYHTSDDNLSIMSDESLGQAVDVLRQIVDVFETDAVLHRQFTGLVALSNPKYGLYVERPDPIIPKPTTPQDIRLGVAQDHLPRFFDGRHSIFELAERFDVPFPVMRTHLERFAQKGLVRTEPVMSWAGYRALEQDRERR